jgi:hypothetical protein
MGRNPLRPNPGLGPPISNPCRPSTTSLAFAKLFALAGNAYLAAAFSVPPIPRERKTLRILALFSEILKRFIGDFCLWFLALVFGSIMPNRS